MALSILAYILISVFIVSLISFIGIFMLSLRKDVLRKILTFLMSFAIGALLGDAFLHLLPEAVSKNISSLTLGIYSLVGIFVFFVIEKFLRLEHAHLLINHKENVKPYAWMNLVGDIVHNFIDGAVIAGSYLINIPLGLTTTLAVIAHEIPQEIGDFAVLIKGGFKPARALFYNFITALTAVAGGLLTFFFGAGIQNLSAFIVPFTFAGFIYIATATLIPELHHENTFNKLLIQIFGIALGIGVMGVLLVFG